MNKIRSAFSIGVMILAVYIARGISDQKPQWKGKIEIENGVNVIKNPKEPLWGNIKLKLVEDLSIGSESDEKYMFYGGLDIVVNHEEEIFVLDRGNCRIQKFDKNGRYLQSIGRKGQGPGEFQSISGAIFDSKGFLYVNQGRGISVFDQYGHFLKSIPLNSAIFYFGITPEGNILATTSSINPSISDDLISLDPIERKQKILARFPNPRIVAVGGAALGARNSNAPYLYFHSIDEKTFIYGFSSSYRFSIIDQTGKVISIFEKEEHPEAITAQDKESDINAEIEYLRKREMLIPKKDIEDNYPFPAHKPLYSGLVTYIPHIAETVFNNYPALSLARSYR